MSSRPWYKWFPTDFAGKTSRLSLEEKGAYRELLDEIWVNGPIQNEAVLRGRILGIHGNCERRLWRVLRPFFTVENGLISHPKLDAQRAEVSEKVEKARKAGRKGGVANAKATRARARSGARGGTNARPQPDPDRSLNTGVDLPRLNLNPDARASDCLTPEQRAEAERMQAELENRRAQFGVAAGGGLRPVSSVEVEIKPGNSDPGNSVEDEK